jgi:hypothetical protein
MAVMARRIGRWDRGVHEIPSVVADRGAGRPVMGDASSAGGAGEIRGTRAEGKRIDQGFGRG